MSADPNERGAPAWAMTFGDLMSLMLVFFVLLSSFATLDAQRFEVLSQSLQAGFGENGGRELVLIGAPAGPNPGQAENADSAQTGENEEASRAAQLRLAVSERRLERVLELETTPRGVTLRAPAALRFAESSDEFAGEALPVLHEVAGVLAAVPGDIAIEGHASDPGVSGSESFALSSARALAALRHLVEVEGIDRRRLSVSGFGDVRPLVANSGPLARERNRRVEFVLLRASGPAANEDRKAR